MIFSSRSKTIGNKNIIIAVLAIYSSLPFLIVFHIFGIILFILPVSYLLSCNKYKLSQFMGFDRYKLPQLSIIDQLNCLYCSYANGLATYYQFKIKELFLFTGSINPASKIIICIMYPFFYISTQLYRIHSSFTYKTIIFPIISYHPPSPKQVLKNELNNKQSLNAKNRFIRMLLKKERIFSIVIANGLSAVEAYWCPLKNQDNDGIIYPKHHDFFYDLQDENDVIKLLKYFR